MGNKNKKNKNKNKNIYTKVKPRKISVQDFLHNYITPSWKIPKEMKICGHNPNYLLKKRESSFFFWYLKNSFKKGERGGGGGSFGNMVNILFKETPKRNNKNARPNFQNPECLRNQSIM
jgi:hypothetical protein